MKKIFIFLLILMPLIYVFPQVDNALSGYKIFNLFAEGTENFNKATEVRAEDSARAIELYNKAIIHFESIINEGKIRNGKLFYHTGNAYFLTGDIGRAILYYKTAIKYIPGDENLIQNMAFVKSMREDKIEAQQNIMALKIIFFWHYIFPSGTRIIIFLIFFILIWIFAGLKLFIKKYSFFKPLIIISIIISGMFFGSLLIESIYDLNHEPGVIVSNEVIARKGDSDTYEPSFNEPIHAGTEFFLKEIRRNWYYIELLDGRECWIRERDAELVP